MPAGAGSGTVFGETFAGADIVSCTWNGAARFGDCSEQTVSGTVVFTATPLAGSLFPGWGVACPGTVSGTNNEICTFTANPASPTTLAPTFNQDVGAATTIAPQGTGSGTVTATAGATIACTWNGTSASGDCTHSIDDFTPPTTIVLQAAAAGVSTFGGWTNCPGLVSGTNNTVCTYTVDDAGDDYTIRPTFTGADANAVLTVTPEGTGAGTLTITGPGGATVVTCTFDGTAATGDCTETIVPTQGGQFVLTATPAAGSTFGAFANCPGTVSSDGRTCTFTVDDPADDFTVRATFTTTPGGGNGCTITGTEGDDVLTGTSDRDVICGLGGDDQINAMGGDDVVLGGAGDDRLFGGGGGDRMNGGAGDDLVNGKQGTDSLTGGAGNDRLYGDAGTDSMSGGAGADRLYGGGGSDSMSGSAGDDSLYGGGGPDTISGGAGFDRAFGGPGPDRCSAERRSSC
jgi:Ca2+-binding RTX toxin-like protein